MNRSTLGLVVVGVVLLVSCGADDVGVSYELNRSIQNAFDNEHIAGTIVIQPVGSDALPIVSDSERSQRAVPPAETFRPLADLILLETGTVASLDDEWRWDRTGPYVQDWDRTHSIRSASVPGANGEWLYRQAIDDLGLARAAVWVERAEYGNRNIGTRGGTSFWMDGTLLISPRQQADFMELLFSEKHPFDHYAALDTKALFLTESGDQWTLRYVEGRVPGERTADKIGWLVGIVDTPEGSWTVAMNADVHWDRTIDPGQPLRITIEALKIAGVIE